MDDTRGSAMQHIDSTSHTIQDNTPTLQSLAAPAIIGHPHAVQQHRQHRRQRSQEHIQQQLQAQSFQRAFDQHPNSLRYQLSQQQQQQQQQQQRPQQPQHGVPQQGVALQRLLDQQHAPSQSQPRDGEQTQALLLQRQQQQQQQLLRAPWKALPRGQAKQQHHHRQQQGHQDQVPMLASPLEHGSRPSSASGSATANDCLENDYAGITGATETPPPPSPPQPPYVFTSHQLESLRGQIATYRQLVGRMDQAKAERSAFVAKSQAYQQPPSQAFNLSPPPAQPMSPHELASVISSGIVLPPILAPKLPGSSYTTPSPPSGGVGGGIGGSPSLRWHSGGACSGTPGVSPPPELEPVLAPGGSRNAIQSQRSKEAAFASVVRAVTAPGIPSLVPRVIGESTSDTSNTNAKTGTSGNKNNAPLPPLSSITPSLSAIAVDPTGPAAPPRPVAVMDRRKVGVQRGPDNDGGGGATRDPEAKRVASQRKADARAESRTASRMMTVEPTAEGAFPALDVGEEQGFEEEFVPTPVLRWRQANSAAAEGGDGDASKTQNEHVSSYGVYFPLHPMESAAPYPVSCEGVGPAIKKQTALPWNDPSVESFSRSGEVGETLAEREVRLLRELEKEKENDAAAGEGEADHGGRLRVKERDLLAVRALRLQKACRKQAVEIAREVASRPFAGEGLLDWHSFYRTKSPSLREARVLEKEKRRQAIYREEAKRRRYQHYIKTILSHRVEFSNFHRAKRLIVSKLARACVSRTEDVAARERREEDRAERKRIQALRMNDIEAYTKLVEETKSERLKYLLGQTDQYIREIGLKIEEQREEGRAREERELELAAGIATDNDFGAGASGSGKEASGDNDQAEAKKGGGSSGGGGGGHGASLYFRKAHSKSEAVRQPLSLKGGVLKEYQLQGLQWMVSLYNNNLNGILADEMGLGKTIQTIALITYLMEVKQNHGPFLVVVPLSTLSNWVNEFSKWAPDAIVVTYKGTPTTRKDIQRQEMESGQFNVLLTTYDYVMKDKAILRKPTWQYIIVDEGHRMKNAQSKFAQTLGTMYQSRNRLLLTGTPLQNNLPELWSLLNFLLPTIFNSVDTFDHWFNQPFATFKSGGTGAAAAVGDDNGADGEQESALMTSEERMLVINRLHELLRPFMLRRVKTEVMGQLPEKVEKVLRCDLSGWQRSLYKQIQESGAFGIAQDQGMSGASGKGLNNVFMQLRKVCNHPYLFFDDRWPSDMDLIRSSGKFELLDRILPKLKAGGHRILMFSQMTRAMDILEDFFTFRGYSYLRLDGATSSDEREKRMARFNAPDSPYFVFVLSTRAGGLGLNLATADTVILFDSDWNPMMDAQAQDRAHRIGQKHEVRVFRLVTDSPVEERIISRATDKLNMTGLVVEAGKFNRDSKAAERKAMLEALLREMDEEGVGEDSGETVVHDSEQINELMATTTDEMEQYQAMDHIRAAQEAEMARKKGLRRWQRLMPADEAPAWLSPGAAAAAIAKAGGRISGSGPGGSGVSVPWVRGSKGGGAEEAGSAEATASSRGARRKRAPVDYWDGLTDRQFDSLVESGDITEALMSDRARRASAKARNSSSPSPQTQGSRAGAAGPGAEGSRDGANSKRRKQQQSGDDEDVSDGRGRGLKAEAIVAMKQALKDIKKAEDPEDGHQCCELYKKLPPRREFKDYYEVIDNPIDLQIIASKVRNGKYHTLKAFEADVHLLFDNAREYNLEGSQVYQDANMMQAIFSKSMGVMYSKESEWVVLDGHAEAAKVGSITRAGGTVPTDKAGKATTAEDDQESGGSDEEALPRGALPPRRHSVEETRAGIEGQSKREGKTDRRRRVSGTSGVPSGGAGRGRPAKGGRGETPGRDGRDSRDSAGRGSSGRGAHNKMKGPRQV